MTLLLVYATVAIAVSFLCSLLEACLLSIPRSYVESMIERGSRVGERLRAMKESIDRPLAAILTLNTIAHTAGAAGVGAQAAVVFGSTAVGIASAIMTLAVLVFSEIIPKTLGAVHAKALAGFTTHAIRVLIWVCLPLIVPLEWINRLFSRSEMHESVSRAELIATIRLGQASGVLGEREHRLAMNLMALSSTRLDEVMTPRTVVSTLRADETVAGVLEGRAPPRFARMPVLEAGSEKVVGYATRFALHEAMHRGEGQRPVGELAETMPALPETASVADAMDRMIGEQRHIALVVDEYGATAGIVTLEDLVETLLGDEIVDETDPAVDMREVARLARGRRGERRPGPAAR